MRGDSKDTLPQVAITKQRRQLSSALIIDKTGVVQYDIVSTWWTKGIVICFGIMLTIVIVLVMLIMYNKTQIDDLKEQINVEENTNYRAK